MNSIRARASLAALTLLALSMASPAPVPAAPSANIGPSGPPPFAFPFAGTPGPSTWLIGQLYGNTTGAYNLGDVWYAAGQGLHFGLDIIAPCGTPVLSIGDGEVVQADWTARGAGPHNLVVRHPREGVAVLYGHLLERPDLAPGEAVTRTQAVGRSGDPDST